MLNWIKKNRYLAVVLAMSLASCAGMERSCTSCTAESFGADWIVVQYKVDGTPIACWTLKSVSVTNETQSDGIYWKSANGHMVHISGWYNRVQVSGGEFKTAASDLGIDLDKCQGGKYGPVN